MTGIEVAVSFPEGPTEISGSFVVFYRNQFGLVCWAYRDAEEMLGLLNADAQETLLDSEDDVPGSGAGMWYGDEEGT
jgi:hypothetical protein